MQKVNINNFNISYENFKNVSDENIVFIHGNLASSEWWHHAIEALTELNANYETRGTALCADWRGYGDSKGLSDISEINFEQFAEDYIELIKLQNLKCVHLVGHSTGGLIAMMALLKAPELFKSLTLVDSVGPNGLELQLPKEQVMAHFEQMSVNKSYSEQVLASTIQGMDSSSEIFQSLFSKAWACDKVMWKGVIEVLSQDIDIADRLNEIEVPTLILHGELDLVIPKTESEKIHKMISHSKLKMLKDQGHSFMMENPSAFAQEISTFWKSINVTKNIDMEIL